jgi:DNA-binding response OmpR family regulator
MENVLVVEDEANILKLVAVNLSSRGYQVFEAKNGTEALDLLRTKMPALMVLDIRLPDFTGWDLLKQMKFDPKIKPQIPVLVMTASLNDAYVDLGAYPTVMEVLIKPFSSFKLLAAVERALRKDHHTV